MRVPEDSADLRRHGEAMSTIRVLVVDDQQMMGELLASGLAGSCDFWVLGRYRTDDPRLRDAVGSWRPDVITLDAGPLGPQTPAVIRRLEEVAPASRVVVLATETDAALCVAAAHAGAAAWLDMHSTLDELVSALRVVHLGGAVYPPELLGAVLRSLREEVRLARSGQDALGVLSVRERQVLSGMMEGRTGAQIAKSLFLSTNTVRTHSRSILVKLAVHSRLEAVALARAAGLRAPVAEAPDTASRSNGVGVLMRRPEPVAAAAP
jgi:two-component system nitrate/nitrite response regulator NarL